MPDPERLLHLQFRRFAGCPFCHLHLQTVAARHDELVAADVQEVALYHSTAASLLKQQVDPLPFPVVADPDKALYREFGVETSARSILDPRGWPAAARGLGAKGWRQRIDVRGGITGLPADFLIDSDGSVVAAHYGRQADDQWSVDQVIELATTARSAP